LPKQLRPALVSTFSLLLLKHHYQQPFIFFPLLKHRCQQLFIIFPMLKHHVPHFDFLQMLEHHCSAVLHPQHLFHLSLLPKHQSFTIVRQQAFIVRSSRQQILGTIQKTPPQDYH
jgi:hypothetical protein